MRGEEVKRVDSPGKGVYGGVEAGESMTQLVIRERRREGLVMVGVGEGDMMVVERAMIVMEQERMGGEGDVLDRHNGGFL